MGKRKLKALSLFSGCGGMDLGLEGGFALPAACAGEKGPGEAFFPENGIETVFACDIMPDAKAAWNGFFSSRRDVSGVFRLESAYDLAARAGAGEDVFPEADIVTGGFPCNDFSVSGKRMGFGSGVSHDGGRLGEGRDASESRGMLYLQMRDIVSIVRPKLFIAENVRGLASMEGAKAAIERDFREAGYLVPPARLLKAPEFGVPQTRERLIFFGFREDALTDEAAAALSAEKIPKEFDPYPAPLFGEGLLPVPSCGDVFAGLDEPSESDDPAQRAVSGARFLPGGRQGEREVSLSAPGPTVRAEHHGHIEFRRLSKEHGGKMEDELAAGLPERRLSVRECARLQTFPDAYPFIKDGKGSPGVSATSAYRMIGNAVPPLLAWRIGERVSEKWGLWFGEEG